MSSAESDPVTSSTRKAGRLLLLSRVVFGLTILAIVAGLVVGILDARRTGSSLSGGDVAFVLGFIAFPIVGYILAARRPDNSISWLLQGIGAALGLDIILSAYASYAIHGGVGGRDLGALAAAFDGPMWVPIIVLPITFLILLFPDGHLPSPRWRWFARLLGAAIVVIFLAILFGPGNFEDVGFANVQNPLGIESLRPALDFLLVLIGMIPIGIAASLVSLVRRFRRSTGIERLQLRWLVSAAAAVAVLYSIVLPIGLATGWGTTSTPGWVEVLETASVAGFALIPLAIGVSVLRYRLFEIDVVINRAVLFGALALFITAVYVGIVVGVGALVGSQASPLLSAAAAAVVALAFQPARRRAQRFADRLVYGQRATPYEVLSEFSDRLGFAYAADELLPRMARALTDGTGAARGDVWVRVGDDLRAEATWPKGEEPVAPIPVDANAEGSVTASSILEPVRHQGELLGALSIKKKPGESITPTEEKLVRDLAAQAGLVMRNARLIEELRASRQRLVAAQDEERRRLERNIHDGAQQQLVALTVKARLAHTLTERDPDRAQQILAELQSDANDALENLRDLARGVYPPLLADKGLVAALEAQARKGTVPITVEADGVGRFSQDVEATVYFCALEALQNVAKYAEATRATVRLTNGSGGLRFEVSDDGVGFDPASREYGTGLQGIADRLAALGGTLEISSERDRGTTILGSVPIQEGPQVTVGSVG
jgi:signal transduction histidine kinase